jgi:hypothetical protein
VARAAGLIGADWLVELARPLVSISSTTHCEHEIAEWIHERFRAMGLGSVRRLAEVPL